jgi:hypothetical protein
MNDKAVVHEIVTNESEREKALAMARALYTKAGYGPTDEGRAIWEYVSLPESITLKASVDGQMYATVSIIPDNPKGMPMDSIYRDELNQMRVEGKRLAEVTQLAVEHELYSQLTGRSAFFASTPILGHVLGYAITKNIDYLCISVIPSHSIFYRLLGFKVLGETKQYARFNTPAVGLIYQVADWNRGVTGLISREIKRHIPSDDFYGKQI